MNREEVQLWSNSINFSAGMLKKQPDAFTLAGNGKTLVVYFTHDGNTVFKGNESDIDAVTSASVQRSGDRFPPQVIDGKHKGNTQIIAEYIAAHTGADSYAIKVTEADKYPLDGYETLNFAQQQLRNKARPALGASPELLQQYGVIYLGFPIWYGTMPMPVFSFLEKYDFSGKVIIPFSTHDGSGLGNSKRDIRSACPQAVVLDGLAIRHNQVQRAEKEVTAWLDSLSVTRKN